MAEQNFKTGQKAPESGLYLYNGPSNGKIGCKPTSEEMIIPLSKDETFPPIKSCGSSANWKLYRKA